MPYLYAVTEADAPLPEGPGLDGAELEAVRAAGLAAIASAPPQRLDASEARLRRHEAIVEAAMARGPVLPMRFGSVVGDVESFLAERHAELSAALERVRGAVELGVRVVGEPIGAAPASGTEYLQRRAAAAAREDHVHATLAPLARASARGAYLVDSPAVGRFRAGVQRLDRQLGGDALVCTGPWPPWSFT